MNRWFLLSIAVGSEVAGTLALRAATNGSYAWYALVVAGYAAAFASLSRILRQGLSIGVVYGIWAASGVALTAVLAVVLFDEPLTLLMAVGIVVVMIGVFLTETGSENAPATPRRSSR